MCESSFLCFIRRNKPGRDCQYAERARYVRAPASTYALTTHFRQWIRSILSPHGLTGLEIPWRAPTWCCHPTILPPEVALQYSLPRMCLLADRGRGGQNTALQVVQYVCDSTSTLDLTEIRRPRTVLYTHEGKRVKDIE